MVFLSSITISLYIGNKMKDNKYIIVGLKEELQQINGRTRQISNTHIQDRSIPWFVTDISIKKQAKVYNYTKKKQLQIIQHIYIYSFLLFQHFKLIIRMNTYLYAESDTLMRPLTPFVSVLLVRFTVLPNKQYLGMRFPITPVITSPECIPIVIQNFYKKFVIVGITSTNIYLLFF